MMENEHDWLDRINSSSPSVRISALEPLFIQMSGELYSYFLKWLESSELANDCVQDTFWQLASRLIKPLDQAESKSKIRGYIWKTAQNVRNDKRRKSETFVVSLEETTAKDSRYLSDLPFEDRLRDRWYLNKMRNLVQHLPYEADRFIMVLSLYGLSKKQISWLTPWSVDKIYDSVNNSKKILKYQFPRSPEYLWVPGKNKQLLSFADDSGYEGMTLANTQLSLEYFSSETSLLLCKTLGLKNIQQLPVLYSPVLVILNAYSEYPVLRLSFSLRSDFNLSVFRGAPIHYLDGVPAFRHESVPGKGKRERLWLDDVYEFKAWLDDYPEPRGDVKIVNWIYDLPERIEIVKEEKESLLFLDEKTAREPVLLPFWTRLAT